MSEERIWCVRGYPDGDLLSTALSYDECDRWRSDNNPRSCVVPAFFDLAAVPE